MAFGTPTDGGAAYSATNGTSVAPVYPAGIAANDVLLLVVGQKPNAANGGTVTTPTGWTLREELTGAGGYGATLGADTGNTNLRIYSKDTVAGTETGTLTVTIGANSVSWAVIVRIPTAGVGATFTYGSADGSRTTAPTSGVAFTTLLTNGATAPALASGDMAVWAMCIPTDVNLNWASLPTISSTGTTFGTAVELEEPNNANGNDIGGYVAYALATTGTSAVAPTVGVTGTGTMTNVRGPIALVRVRETLPARTGTMAATETGADTLAGTGTVVVDGDLAATETGSDTFAASGTVTNAAITGTLAATETGPDTAAIAGQVLVAGTLGATESGADVLAATGTVAWPTITGTLAASESGADTLAASGAVEIRGSLGATESGSDTFAASGTVAWVAVTGTMAATETGADVLAASGQVIIAGSLGAVETGPDALAASGTVAWPVIAGSLSATESGSDVLAATGTVEVRGALAGVEVGSDTFLASGAVEIAGALAADETGADTFAATGAVTDPVIVGELAAVEVGSDTAAMDGRVVVAGSLAADETGADTAAIAGTVAIAGSGTAVLGLDVSAFMENTSNVTAVIFIVQTVEASTTAAVSGAAVCSLVIESAAAGTVANAASATASLVLNADGAAAVDVVAVGAASLGITAGGAAVTNTRGEGSAVLAIGTDAAGSVAILATGQAGLLLGVTAAGQADGDTAFVVLTIRVTATAGVPIAVTVVPSNTVRVTAANIATGVRVTDRLATATPRISTTKTDNITSGLRVLPTSVVTTRRVRALASIIPR